MNEVQNQSASSVPKGRGEPAGSGKPAFWRRRPVIVVGTVLLAGLLFYGLDYLVTGWTHESTDDAFLDAHIVSVAPKVAGQVKQVAVKDNQEVKVGDLLLEIDPSDWQAQLEQKQAAQEAARANVASAKANVELFRTQITTAEASAKQTEAEVAASRAVAERARSDLKRAQDLIRNQTISPQEFDTAKANADAADANLRAAQERATSEQSKVAQAQAQLQAGLKVLERAEALTTQATAEVKTAELNLSYTRVIAPEAGRVTKKAVQTGDYLQVGQRLLALVPTNLFVTANFKETQLQQLRPGQPAEISIDSVAAGPFAGHVDSIMAGSGASFSLLPPENAVGNYVKVVQRVPVKIVFDKPVEAGHVLGPGMSVVPSVHVKSFEISVAVILIAAVVLALLLGVLWWMMTGRRREVP